MGKHKSTDSISLRETVQLGLRGYGVWWAERPKLLISTVIHVVVSALTPYVGIWFLAQLINEVAGGRDANTLTALALGAIGSTSVLTLLGAGLERWKNVQWANLWHVQNKILMQKLLQMDFAAVNDPHIQALRFQIWENSNSGAWGLFKLLFCFQDMAKALMSAACAIVLTVPLFTQPVPDSGGGLTLFNHPMFILLLLAAMLAITFLAPFFSAKAGSYWAKLAGENNQGNRFFFFWFGEVGGSRTRALDIRIYRQDILGKHYVEKTNSFAADSKLSKASKGPMGGYNALSAAVSQLFAGIAYVFVCLKALGGAFGIGSVTQYVAAITALSGGVSSFMEALGDLRNNTVFLRTVFEFLDVPNTMYQGTLPVEKRAFCEGGDNDYEITFRAVSFQYPGSDTYALRDVSLKFRTGQRLAVVGMNGSGKTTFIKLLCRLYDPTEGEILLNGININKYDYKEYMSIFSVMFQDFKLLSFGLGQNIAAQTAFDSHRAGHCLQAAGFGDRLAKLKNGLATTLYQDFDEAGVDVSGGEAQKIALARSLYKEAPFVILDEPTAALDPVAEFEVYSKMNELVGSKTAVFISHRLSSCRFCHDIAVFHEGRVIQRGSHDTLVREEAGKYYALWNAQAQYYK